MQVAYRSLLMIYYLTVKIKVQTKATAAFKGNFAIYGPILIL